LCGVALFFPFQWIYTAKLVHSDIKHLEALIFFNAFHTVVLKINLLETIKHNKYIGLELQDVFYKIQQDDMFRST